MTLIHQIYTNSNTPWANMSAERKINITVLAGDHDHKYSMIINNPYADGLSRG